MMLLPFALLRRSAARCRIGHVWLALLVLPPALALIYRFMREPAGRGFNRILVWTVQIQLLFSLLLSARNAVLT